MNVSIRLSVCHTDVLQKKEGKFINEQKERRENRIRRAREGPKKNHRKTCKKNCGHGPRLEFAASEDRHRSENRTKKWRKKNNGLPAPPWSESTLQAITKRPYRSTALLLWSLFWVLANVPFVLSSDTRQTRRRPATWKPRQLDVFVLSLRRWNLWAHCFSRHTSNSQ